LALLLKTTLGIHFSLTFLVRKSMHVDVTLQRHLPPFSSGLDERQLLPGEPTSTAERDALLLHAHQR